MQHKQEEEASSEKPWSKVAGTSVRSHVEKEHPNPIPYFLALPIFPAFLFAGYYMAQWTGHSFFTFSAVLAAFVLVPIVDETLGKDHANFSAQLFSQVNPTPFRVVLWLMGFCCTAAVVWGAPASLTLSWPAWIGHVLSTGIISGGLGITFAHELIHKDGADRLLGMWMLSMVCYPHFAIEHVEGHHKNVATYNDPATSRLGESLYQFLPRTISQSYLHAWQLEREKAAQQGYDFWGPRNRMFWLHLVVLMLCAYFLWEFGPWGLAFFLAQAVWAFTLLEIINYLEHYGLVRARDEQGQHESVEIRHSWESRERMASYLLVRLQRHPDHHRFGKRAYYLHQVHDDAPQLPYGYPVMLLVSLVPPLWRHLMDKRVRAYREEVEKKFGPLKAVQ